jgi:hypothetical protein
LNELHPKAALPVKNFLPLGTILQVTNFFPKTPAGFIYRQLIKMFEAANN